MAATASRIIEAPPERVFTLLADLAEHWRLAGDWVEVLALEPPTGPATGALVRLRDPLGIHRTARTSVDITDPPHLLAGHAETGRRTRAAVQWTLRAADDAAHVELRVELQTTSRLDRALWALVGERWVESRLTATLDHLAAWASDQPVAARGPALAPAATP